MNQVTSKDGTTIAYDRQGAGPAVILVGGGIVDRSENTPLVPELVQHFTTYNYDRRGRGRSGDTSPYAIEREIEDIDALITEAGGSAHLYGVSSGGALVLEAVRPGRRGGTELTHVAGPGGSRTHPRLRCSLSGRRPAAGRPPGEDHSPDPGHHRHSRTPARSGELGPRPRPSSRRDCCEHPEGAAPGH